MAKLIFVTGGAHSGKSAFAEKYASNYESVTYYTAGLITNNEMRQWVKESKAERPANWRTKEMFLGIGGALIEETSKLAIVDCITTLVSSIVLESGLDFESLEKTQVEQLKAEVVEEIEKLLAGIKAADCDVIAITNELGMSVVPRYPLGGVFRDTVGAANAKLAAAADEAYILISGLPLKRK